MSTRGIAACLSILFGALAASANADETVVVQGQITGQAGTDVIFPGAGSDLVGQPFYIVYQLFDSPSDTQPYVQTFDPPYGSSVSGGGAAGQSPVTATVGIGGVVFDDQDQWTNGEASREAPASGQSEVYFKAEDTSWSGGDLSVWTDISSTTDPFVSDPDYRGVLVHTVTTGDLATGGLSETYADPANSRTLETASFTLTPTSISVFDDGVQIGGGGGDPPGVPEPAIWALMVVGVSCVGASLRRRRSFAI